MSRAASQKPLVAITGAAGRIGGALAARLADAYEIVGFDLKCEGADFPCFEFDLGDEASVRDAFSRMREKHGSRIAAVVHLAAYFDFTGEENELYQSVNIDGTRHLMRALQDFEVERVIYSGTMLVHEPAKPGGRIDESARIAPKWAYPISKAKAEEALSEERGAIPVTRLHLAGLYDDDTAVPTLAEQIARIYERDLKAHIFSGDLAAGQSMIHIDDMLDAFVRAIERRNDLPEDEAILVGEPEAPGYGDLQETIGCLIHGEAEWDTITIPAPLARAGAWVQEKTEPIVPDAIDHGEKPFIRPFMVDMASDHYALDISRAKARLGWTPKHDIREGIKTLVKALKADPLGWYEANDVRPPEWLKSTAAHTDENPEDLRRDYAEACEAEHGRFRWAALLNMALGLWLMTSPSVMQHGSGWAAGSDIAAGAAVFLLAILTLSWRLSLLRWAIAAIGCWVMFSPLVFWTGSAAVYLNATLAGGLITGLAAAARPAPGVSPAAVMTGPDIPPGWDYSPSSWFQRLPIITLAVVGLLISRHMTAFQLGHVEGMWDPVFPATPDAPDARNGSEAITTSWVSEAWPVPDAGIGAMVYMLEIIIGMTGTRRRWREMPWAVVMFGLLIVPLGVVSIGFIIIQPILLGTWCLLCLIAAAAMLIQIPYSLDELVATGQFLARRKKAGRPVLRVLFTGDSDEGDARSEDDFRRPPGETLRKMLGRGVTPTWSLMAATLIGVWLMFTRLTVGAEGAQADIDHLIGALVVTASVIAMAETGRVVRYANLLLAAGLVAGTLVAGLAWPSVANSVLCAALLIALSLRRGPVRGRYGAWNRRIA